MSNTDKFIRLIKHPVKFRMFLFSKLPSAYFAGVRVKHFDESKAEVTVPYKWFSQNPFRSTYFACLAMAAEMSTGLLSMMHTYRRQPAVSMLVVSLEAVYHKKATGITTFTCEEGMAIKSLIEEAVHTNEARTFKARSVGRNEQGEPVAEFFITWSFKAKK
ncbi:MAG: DUF4442 domain-containing protein [Ferruginibacter sp.]